MSKPTLTPKGKGVDCSHTAYPGLYHRKGRGKGHGERTDTGIRRLDGTSWK